MQKNQNKSFADKLQSLLNNKHFRDAINEYDSESDFNIDFQNIKKEMINEKINKGKKRREEILNEKRKILCTKKENEEQKDNKLKSIKEIEVKKKKFKKNNKINKNRLECGVELNDQSLDENNMENKKSEPNNPYLFFYKDNNRNNKSYTFHRIYKEFYHLRCTDRKCSGTAKYNIINGEIQITKDCTLSYDQHSYIKEHLIKKKIMENDLNSKDIDDNEEVQEVYFKYLNSIYPNFNYYDIALYLHEKFKIKKIIYTKKEFINYKINNKKQLIYSDQRIKLLDEIELDNEKLLKIKLEFMQENKSETYTIRIYGTNESIKLLNDPSVTQYFIDGTYRCVPHTIKSVNALVAIVCYNAETKKFELCLIATMNKEDFDCYKQFYSLLKNRFNFKPLKITCDFALSNIKAIKEVFNGEETLLIPCFFHLVQSWWRNAGKFGLRKKNIVEKTRVVIFNLKLLPFLEESQAKKFYEKIIEEYDEDSFQPFYKYFEKTWLSLSKDNKSKFNFSLWSYYGKFDFQSSRKVIISKNVLDEYVFLSNNACESMNNLINNYIEINSKVSLDKFITIIKTLFVKLECGRSNRNQSSEKIIHKRHLSDVLLEIINSGFGKNLKIITSEQFKKLGNIASERKIFKIMESNDFEESDENDESIEDFEN